MIRIVSNGERFRELEAQGRERIGRHIVELRRESGMLDAELTGGERQIEARIQELTRANVETVRESIEKSIVSREEARKATEGRRALIVQSIVGLERLVLKDKSLFFEYRGRIQEVLKKTVVEQNVALAGLVASLLLQEGGIKAALSSPSQRALRSSVLVFAPPNQPNANEREAVPALIEGVIPLPTVIGLRNKGVLETLYRKEHLSAREIEPLLGVSHAGVLGALDRFVIPRNGNGHKRTGQLPFGFDYCNYQLVENAAEQAAIQKMRRYRAGGLYLRQIAGDLNQTLIPTKHNGVWQANTVRLVLARA